MRYTENTETKNTTTLVQHSSRVSETPSDIGYCLGGLNITFPDIFMGEE